MVDCRGELRFTPLVSRGGIAADDACFKILDLFIGGLTGFLAENIKKLLTSGVSKYFCSYYAAQALGLLFSRQQIEKNDEKILSAFVAVRHAYRLPFLLFKEGGELVLRSWLEHGGRPVVIGRNVYDSLLRSVAFGLVDFPLPKEVVASPPEDYILSMGAEEVLHAMILLTTYQPSAVLYNEPSRGVFVRWELEAGTKSFGAAYLLEFPEGLRDVAGLVFPMVSCLNSGHLAIRSLMQFAGEVVKRVGDTKRRSVEETCAALIFELGHRRLRGEPGDTAAVKRHLREALSQVGEDEVEVPDGLVELCLDARVIRDDLWRLGE